MCLAKVYRRKKDAEELLMEKVERLTFREGKLVLTSLLMEEKEYENAGIDVIDFAKSVVMLKLPAD